MRPFPDCAIARFVVCCSERVAPVVLSRQQNAILHLGRCKRHWSRRQERICRATSIAPSLAALGLLRTQAKFGPSLLVSPADVPL